jgi:hypothetical protein
MIPLCSRFDSVLFTPKMSAIASYSNFSRSPVDYSALTYLGLQSIELLVSALTHRSINKSDLIGLQFSMKQFEQITPANGVNQHRGIFDWPPLEFHAIAMETDVNANHARTKRLEQHLGVRSVVAEIRLDFDADPISLRTGRDPLPRQRARRRHWGLPHGAEGLTNGTLSNLRIWYGPALGRLVVDNWYKYPIIW